MIELLLVRPLDWPRPESAGPWTEDWEVLAKGLGSAARPGLSLQLDGAAHAEILSVGERGAARVRFHGAEGCGLLALADRIGAIPLPPYIESARKRGGSAGGDLNDRARYQTVYARAPGAVAAPTAGLHFTEGLLRAIGDAGHELTSVTLHVGPGTFRPVEVSDPARHVMDPERYEISPPAAEAIERARGEGRPVVAVGTTVVRVLETAARAGDRLRPGSGSTDLYLLPGAEFRLVTDLVTNFHLPRSTLLMLVAAFAGRERVLSAYEEAVRQRYRFYSYGDAMFLRPGALPA